jgi:hypothetical protein
MSPPLMAMIGSRKVYPFTQPHLVMGIIFDRTPEKPPPSALLSIGV